MINTEDYIALVKPFEKQEVYESGNFEYYMYVYDPVKQLCFLCDEFTVDDYVLTLRLNHEIMAVFDVRTHQFWSVHKSLVTETSPMEFAESRIEHKQRENIINERVKKIFGGNESDS